MLRDLGLFLGLFLVLFAVTFEAEAGERERAFRRGAVQRRGNEASLRVGRIPLGQLQFGGNGCPAGTMRVAFAPDSLSFSVLFDQFVAETKEGDRRGLDVMTCDALVPVQIPENTQMEITRVDFRGFSALPQGAYAELHSVFNFLGRGGDGDRMNLKYRFTGPTTENYEISSDVITNGDTEISPCGGTAILRIRNQLRVVAKSREQATVTLDSVDGSAHAVYQVSWRTCRANGGRPMPPGLPNLPQRPGLPGIPRR